MTSEESTHNDETVADTAPGLLMLQLLDAFMWLDRGLQDNLKARGLPNVRRLESMVLMWSLAGIGRPSDIAAALGVTRQSVNSALRELEAKKLIRLVPDPADARCKIVETDPAAAHIHQAAADIMLGLEETLSERLGQDSVARLNQSLNKDWGEPPII